MSSPYDEWTYDELQRSLHWKQRAIDNVLGDDVVAMMPHWSGSQYEVEVWVYAEKKAYYVDPSPDCDPVIDFVIAKFPNADWELEGYSVEPTK